MGLLRKVVYTIVIHEMLSKLSPKGCLSSFAEGCPFRIVKMFKECFVTVYVFMSPLLRLCGSSEESSSVSWFMKCTLSVILGCPFPSLQIYVISLDSCVFCPKG